MRSELHRNQVTDAQTVDENLRDAAHHEAGHVVVARFFGLTIREVEIEEDGSGRADISSGEHLPLVDQIAINCLNNGVSRPAHNLRILHRERRLLGVKRTWRLHCEMSALTQSGHPVCSQSQKVRLAKRQRVSVLAVTAAQ
jgi:hypothetical protein